MDTQEKNQKIIEAFNRACDSMAEDIEKARRIRESLMLRLKNAEEELLAATESLHKATGKSLDTSSLTYAYLPRTYAHILNLTDTVMFHALVVKIWRQMLVEDPYPPATIVALEHKIQYLKRMVDQAAASSDIGTDDGKYRALLRSARLWVINALKVEVMLVVK